LVDPFGGALPDGHSLYVIDPADLELGEALDLPNDISHVFDLTYDIDQKQQCVALVAGLDAPVTLFTNILTATATAVASALDGTTVVGISYVPALFAASNLIEAAPSLQCTAEAAEHALAELRQITGREVETLTDRVALVSMRTLALIINEAAFALMEGVAGAGDIDVAMQLGTNYPEGPFRWADAIGADIVVQTLGALHDEYGEERYRPCVLLKQMARAGARFHTAAQSA